MKKVLLTSAVALAAFGAVQSVSADVELHGPVLAAIRDEKAKAEAQAVAKHINAVQKAQLNVLNPLYDTYKKAEATYTSLSSDVKEAYANLEKLKQEKIRLYDMVGDAKGIVKEVKELNDALSETSAKKVKAEADVVTYKSSVETTKAAREAAVKDTQAREAELKVAMDSKDEQAIKRGQEALEKAQEAQNKAVKAEKEANEKLAQAQADKQKFTFDEARIEAAIAYANALVAGDAYGITKAGYELEDKIAAAQKKADDLSAKIPVARAERDKAKDALEAAEKTASQEYQKVGLSYSRSVLEEADVKANAVTVGWYKADNGSWSYIVSPKGEKATGWKFVDGAWYHFNAEGVMQKWWVKDGNTWYYLNGSGAMQTGWLQDGDKWYYLENSGAMKASQWFEVGGKWYYVDGSGALAVNTTVGGYTVNGNGEWVK